MGVTIHYRGKINDVKNVDALTDEMIDFAGSLGWKHTRLDEDWSKPNTAKLVHKEDGTHVEGHAPLRGVILRPHKESESLSLTFNADGLLVDIIGMVWIAEGGRIAEEQLLFTKTQFAPLEVHIAIIKLLRHLKTRYISDLEVRDEGSYWESNDANELKRRMDIVNRGIDILSAAFSASHEESSKAKSPEELAKMIEKIFREKFGG